jgi:hypothetical protein
VVATNKENYETGLLKLVINVTPASSGHPAEVPIHSVKLKIDNLNLVRVAALLYCKKTFINVTVCLALGDFAPCMLFSQNLKANMTTTPINGLQDPSSPQQVLGDEPMPDWLG